MSEREPLLCRTRPIPTLVATVAASALLLSCGGDLIPATASTAPDTTPTTSTAPVDPTDPADPADSDLSDLGPGDVIWSEEFDGDDLDPSTWGYESPFTGAGDGSVHVYRPEGVAVADGLLRITATRLEDPLQVDDDGDGAPDRTITWQSGFITTRERVDFANGRFEVRARMPEGRGLWPAVWLRPLGKEYGAWPRSGEIDIVEVLGHDTGRAHTTAHWWDREHVLDAVASELSHTADGFHVFALEWTPGSLVWLIDGAIVHELHEWATELGPAGAPFDRAFHLNVNLAVGGSWPGMPDAGTHDGAALEVDWIRVTELPGSVDR